MATLRTRINSSTGALEYYDEASPGTTVFSVATSGQVIVSAEVEDALDLGSSGTAGSLDVFPSTASKGKLTISAADSAGNTTTTITNASQAAARTYTIPDGGAAASFVLTEEAAFSVNSVAGFTFNVGAAGSGVGLLKMDDAAISSFAGATDAAGQDIYIETQDAGATPTTAKAGGLYNLKTGEGAAAADAVACGAGGAFSVITGAGGANTGAATGEAGGAGGALTLTSGVGGTTDSTGAHAGGAGGAIQITSGIGGTQTGSTTAGGVGGELGLTAAVDGAVTTASSVGGRGGSVTVTAGAGGAASGESDTGGEGGDVLLVSAAGGTGGTAGVAGNVISRGQSFMQKKLAQTMAGAATISDSDLLSGVIVGTPTADPSNYTTQTGAQISALFGTTPTVGDSFELTFINVAATNKVIDLVAGGSGMTVTGESIVENATDDPANSSGTFIFVNTAADTWIAYRK